MTKSFTVMFSCMDILFIDISQLDDELYSQTFGLAVWKFRIISDGCWYYGWTVIRFYFLVMRHLCWIWLFNLVLLSFYCGYHPILFSGSFLVYKFILYFCLWFKSHLNWFWDWFSIIFDLEDIFIAFLYVILRQLIILAFSIWVGILSSSQFSFITALPFSVALNNFGISTSYFLALVTWLVFDWSGLIFHYLIF